MSKSQVSYEKEEIVYSTVDTINKFDIIAAADLFKVSSGMLQNMRRKLRDRMTIKCIKNTLMRFALEKAGKENSKEFMDSITGPNVFLFTNGNPFKIAMELDNNKVKVFAKPGDIALSEISISAGNTGLSPGPLIGKFGVLGIRTRIQGGNIWVTQDSLVAKAGDIISDDLADLLQRMGIRVAEMGLRIKAVYEKGEIIPGDALILDLDDYISKLQSAIGNAFQMAISTSYTTPITTPTLFMKAHQDALKIAIESYYLTKETINIIISKTHIQAQTLAHAVGEAQSR
jgi:large subunit ribosomal protein L10